MPKVWSNYKTVDHFLVTTLFDKSVSLFKNIQSSVSHCWHCPYKIQILVNIQIDNGKIQAKIQNIDRKLCKYQIKLLYNLQYTKTSLRWSNSWPLTRSQRPWQSNFRQSVAETSILENTLWGATITIIPEAKSTESFRQNLLIRWIKYRLYSLVPKTLLPVNKSTK